MLQLIVYRSLSSFPWLTENCRPAGPSASWKICTKHADAACARADILIYYLSMCVLACASVCVCVRAYVQTLDSGCFNGSCQHVQTENLNTNHMCLAPFQKFWVLKVIWETHLQAAHTRRLKYTHTYNIKRCLGTPLSDMRSLSARLWKHFSEVKAFCC